MRVSKYSLLNFTRIWKTGHRCYGPFHAPLQQGCCIMLEFCDGGDRTYLFAVRIGATVHACVCSAEKADAYVLDMRMILDSWTRGVAPILEFRTIGDAGNWIRDRFTGVSDWQDRSSLYARQAISATIPTPRIRLGWSDAETAAHAAPATT